MPKFVLVLLLCIGWPKWSMSNLSSSCCSDHIAHSSIPRSMSHRGAWALIGIWTLVTEKLLLSGTTFLKQNGFSRSPLALRVFTQLINLLFSTNQAKRSFGSMGVPLVKKTPLRSFPWPRCSLVLQYSSSSHTGTIDGYLAVHVVEGSIDGAEFYGFVVNDELRTWTGIRTLSSIPLFWSILLVILK